MFKEIQKENLKQKNLRKKIRRFISLKYSAARKLLITNYTLLIFLYSNPSFEGNHEHVSTSFHLKNRLPLCDHTSET